MHLVSAGWAPAVRILIAVLALHALATGAAADPQPAPNEDGLRALEAGGRRIAAYHEAARRTLHSYREQADEIAETTRQVVLERAGATRVIFVRKVPGDEARGWLMVAEAGFNSRIGEVTSLLQHEPARPAPAEALAALRALDVARAAAVAREKEAMPPFQEAVFREKDKTFTVVLQTRPEGSVSVRFGSDLVLKISGDGMQVSNIKAPHGTTSVSVPVPLRAGSDPTLHSHIEGDLPTETDVAVVLERPALAPHLVLTPRYMFRIDEGGGITYLGPNPVPPAAPGGGS